LKYEQVIALRAELIKHFNNTDVKNRERHKELINIINGFTGLYKFITVYDFYKKKFVFHHGVTENTGYTPKEFNIEAINNALGVTPHIIHPDDIEHKLRYDLVMYKLLAEGVKISSLADNYEISMRIILKDGSIKKIRRQTYVFEADENGTPKTQLDIWKILNHTDPYVKVQLNYSGSGITQRFYQINRELLNCKITEKQIEIIKLRHQRFNNKEIAAKLAISPKTVENHIRHIKLKIQDFYRRRNLNEKVDNMIDIIHFINLYGIFSFNSPNY